MCPSTNDNWCKYHNEKFNGINIFKENIGLPISVKKKTYPIFMELSDDHLFEKCLHGGVIWKRCPKDTFVGCITLETSVASVVICYNNGACGILPIYKKLELEL